jgi:DNA-binding NarL/FixJ family response regulator
MRETLHSHKNSILIIGIIILQSICAIFFIADVIGDYSNEAMSETSSFHLVIELVASLTLIVAIILETKVLMDILRRKAHLEEHLTLSQQSLHEVIEENFKEWKLTPAEFDVAMFMFKGMNQSEIAQLRGTSEGTVKAQLSAVYRKAEVQSRAELLMKVIDGIYSQKSLHKK